MNWRIKFLGFCALVLLQFGCGMSVKYGLSGISIPPEVKTLTVKLFDNNATLVNPLLAQVITEKLKDKFIRQTSLKLVTENGDWQFEGAIVGYVVEPVNRQTISGGTRNKLTISIAVKFIDEKGEEVNKSYAKFQDFDANQDFAGLESGLIDELTDLLVQDIFSETALKW